MLTEPGYYKTNDFGIRIEDIAVTVPAKTKVKKCLLFVVNLILVVLACHCINQQMFLSFSTVTTT